MGFTRLETPDPYAKPEPILIPVGTHTLWHRGRLLWFRRELEAENGSRGDKERERLEICILGTSRKPLMQLSPKKGTTVASNPSVKPTLNEKRRYHDMS